MSQNVRSCHSEEVQTGPVIDAAVDGSTLHHVEEGKFLGYWWRHDTMAIHAALRRMRRKHGVPFSSCMGGIGAFQGDLMISPLSTRSVIGTSWCVLVCHGVYLLACVSWCVLVGLCVMVCTCWLVCHGVYLCVMVCTCIPQNSKT